jgi:hypothetical protein
VAAVALAFGPEACGSLDNDGELDVLSDAGRVVAPETITAVPRDDAPTETAGSTALDAEPATDAATEAPVSTAPDAPVSTAPDAGGVVACPVASTPCAICAPTKCLTPWLSCAANLACGTALGPFLACICRKQLADSGMAAACDQEFRAAGTEAVDLAVCSTTQCPAECSL